MNILWQGIYPYTIPPLVSDGVSDLSTAQLTSMGWTSGSGSCTFLNPSYQVKQGDCSVKRQYLCEFKGKPDKRCVHRVFSTIWNIFLTGLPCPEGMLSLLGQCIGVIKNAASDTLDPQNCAWQSANANNQPLTVPDVKVIQLSKLKTRLCPFFHIFSFQLFHDTFTSFLSDSALTPFFVMTGTAGTPQPSSTAFSIQPQSEHDPVDFF